MTLSAEAPVARCPVAHGFDVLGLDYFADPAAHFARFRDEMPVFFYEYLNSWVVTRRDDVELILADWQRFTSGGNSGTIDVPERFQAIVPGDLITQILVGSDPPSHTDHRVVAQRGFTKARMEALQPEIEARANRVIDRFERNGAGNLVTDYALELTTQTIMAHMGLGDEHDDMMRQLRDDFAFILGSASEPMPEPQRSQVWQRYVEATLVLRNIIDERRVNPGQDLISDMAIVTGKDGKPMLSSAQIAIHLTEFAMAGVDSTTQAVSNAVMFLSQNPGVLAEAIADPELWSRVFEETVRRRPSSTFASRQAQQDTELGGVVIPRGDMILLALTSANTDPSRCPRPFEFDIHRPAPEDHLSFTQGRHTCLGQALARVQGATALKVLFERLPSLRPVDDAPLDFLPIALLPVRRNLPVTWDVTDIDRAATKVARYLSLTVLDRTAEADGVVSLTLGDADGGALPPWKPGAHVEVRLGDSGSDLIRQYSLSSSPSVADRWRIGVLREPNSRGGSQFVHEHLNVGDTLTVGLPRNNFHVLPAKRYIFIVGGIGITPILPMIEHVHAQGAQWSLLYGGRTRDSMAFLSELEQYGDRVTVRPQDQCGLLDLDSVLSTPSQDTLVYCCGPEPLLQAVEKACAGWPIGSLVTERFAAKVIVRTEPDVEFEVEFLKSGRAVTVPADSTILEVAEQQGIEVLSSCREGTCGTCETRIVAGRADHRDSILTPTEQASNQTLMACVSRAEKGCSRIVLDI